MIHKAIIPVAGKGIRLWPVTSVLPKALFPLVGCDGLIKTVIQIILEQVAVAGIDDVALVVSPGQAEIIDKYLDAASSVSNSIVLPKISYIEQTNPCGFGDAVLCGTEFIGNEPFLVLLGDHIQIAEQGNESCISQVVNAFEKMKCVAMVGVHEVTKSELSKVGVAKGELLEGGIYNCRKFIEKPDFETAIGKLKTPGLNEGFFLGHCGIYSFSSEIFDCLREEAKEKKESKNEIELAAAQQRLLQKYPEDYYLYRISGKAYDMGTPEGYLRTLNAVAENKE